MKKKLTKTAAMADIHWGCRGNSEQHNQDCLNFIDWFCSQVKKDPTIDNVIFMGDWFENRSALNISTMNWAHKGAAKLNDLGLPVYFIIGNHDLYHRHTREIFSTINYGEFSNFTIINEPTIMPNIHNGVLLCPFLFHDEYPSLAQHLNLSTWWGHFEFKGFKMAVHGMVMPTGPDAADFTGPKYIFSGHFHVRQRNKNIVYIGNTFPTNFGDAGDNNRGMMTYNHITETMVFEDWKECPKYVSTTLTSLLDASLIIPEEARVRCVIDVPISFEESTVLRDTFTEKYKLREFTMEESSDLSTTLTDTQTDDITTSDSVTSNNIIMTIDDLIIKMLDSIQSEHIDNNLLIEQYRKLKP